MRLPSSILAKLTLAGLAVAGCEPAHKPETCKSDPVVAEEDSPPLDEVVRMTNERPEDTMNVRPAAAPKFAPPPVQQQQQQPEPTKPPQPVIKKKPPPRKVFASVCGHAPVLVDESASLVRCGKG